MFGAKSIKPHTADYRQHCVLTAPTPPYIGRTWAEQRVGGDGWLERHLRDQLLSSMETGYHLPKPLWGSSPALASTECLIPLAFTNSGSSL